jgi:hypothetical protein
MDFTHYCEVFLSQSGEVEVKVEWEGGREIEEVEIVYILRERGE